MTSLLTKPTLNPDEKKTPKPVPKFTVPASRRKYWPFLVVIALTLAVAGVLGWRYWQARQQIADLQSGRASAAEVAALTKEVGRLILLPDEQPTVATVTDKEKLSQNAFFQRAENGDKVLLYTQARKAYLYRPQTKQLIEVSPLNVSGDGQAQTGTDQDTDRSVTAKVALYNGTSIAGLTNRYEERLRSRFPELIVASKRNASRNTYRQSLIVDVSGQQAQAVQELAQALNLEVGTLPAEEATPAAGILIILGSDAESP